MRRVVRPVALGLLHGLKPDLHALVQRILVRERLEHHQRVVDFMKLTIVLLQAFNRYFMLILALLQVLDQLVCNLDASTILKVKLVEVAVRNHYFALDSVGGGRASGDSTSICWFLAYLDLDLDVEF